MIQIIAAVVAGLLFGAGLTVSQMVNPAKVLGFLDIAGSWDPSLAFVLAGAVGTVALGFLVVRRHLSVPLFALASLAISSSESPSRITSFDRPCSDLMTLNFMVTELAERQRTAG